MSKVTFLGEINAAFEIKSEVTQGDEISPVLFTSVLEMIIRKFEGQLKTHETEN